MQNYFLDTNFFYSFFNPHDSNHDLAIEIFEVISNKELITNVVVLAELIASGDKLDFISKIEELSIKVIDITYRDIIQLEKLISPKDRRSLKAIDSIILSQCELNRLELISFDSKLQKVWQRI